jgi:hypothetical protein
MSFQDNEQMDVVLPQKFLLIGNNHSSDSADGHSSDSPEDHSEVGGEDPHAKTAARLLNGNNQQLLEDYVSVVNHYHKKTGHFDVKGLVQDGIVVAVSYAIGGVCGWSFVDTAQKAAGDEKFSLIMNTTGAFSLNTLLYGYFGFLSLSSATEWALDRLNLSPSAPQEIKEALCRLQNLDPSKSAERSWKSVGKLSAFVLPAGIAAIPYYVIAKSDPVPIRVGVLLGNTLINLSGVNSLYTYAKSRIDSSIQKSNNRKSRKALERYEINKAINKLKEAHISTFENALEKFLTLTQAGSKDTDLNKIYDLLYKPDPSKWDSLALILKICDFAPENTYQPSAKGRKAAMWTGFLPTILSQPGYILNTKVSVADAFRAFNVIIPALDWSLGLGVYAPSLALSLFVSKEVSETLYTMTAYGAHGIKTAVSSAWQEDYKGMSDFMSRTWKKLSTPAQIIKLPLAFQQNPKAMMMLFGGFCVLSFWSTQTSTYLNEQQLKIHFGEVWGNYLSLGLKAPTISSAMMFNAFPIPSILSSLQRLLTKWCGGESQKMEIWLEAFLKNYIELLKDVVDEDQFLNTLGIISNRLSGDPADQEIQLKKLFGNKDPGEIFGPEHEYAKKSFTEIIPILQGESAKHPNKATHSNKATFFSTPVAPVAVNDRSLLLPNRNATSYMV